MKAARLGPEEIAGLLFAFGFSGYSLEDEHVRLVVKELGVPNIVFFDRNMRSPSQVKRLIASMEEYFRSKGLNGVLAMVDQEGGLVMRMPGHVTPLPGNMALGAVGIGEAAFKAGRIIGLELAAMGINLNLAPVLDVLEEPESLVIGERSFGEDPMLVSRLGEAFIEGLHSVGVGATAKHFPGHGATVVDSHHELPRIKMELHRLEKHLMPFRRAIEAGVEAVMMGHILVESLDPESPASLSSKAVGLLRSLGFKGLVVSDCMEMKAVSATYTPEEIVDKAVSAGLDLIMFSHTWNTQRRAYDRMLKLISRGDVDESRLMASIERREKLLASLKARMSAPPLETIASPSHMADCIDLACRAITLIKGCGDLSPPHRLTIVYSPRLASPSPVAGPDALSSPCSIAEEVGLKAECRELGSENPAENSLVLFRSKHELPLVPRKGWMIVSLGNPVWLRYIDLEGYRIAASTYSHRYCSLKALFQVLKGECRPEGRLPVSISEKYTVGHRCYEP